MRYLKHSLSQKGNIKACLLVFTFSPRMNGTTISNTGYPDLFDALNSTGELDSDWIINNTHIKIPDTRGAFIRDFDGWDNSRDTDRDQADERKIGDYQQDAFQGHYHSLSSGTHVYRNQPTGGHFYSFGSSWWMNPYTLSVTAPTSDGSHGTPRTSSETRSQNILLRYCIKT